MSKSENNVNKNMAKSNQGSFAKVNIIDVIMRKAIEKNHTRTMQNQRGNKKLN